MGQRTSQRFGQSRIWLNLRPETAAAGRDLTENTTRNKIQITIEEKAGRCERVKIFDRFKK